MARNPWGGNSAGRLDRQRQWCDVEQEHVFDFALEYAALYPCANRDNFIRIHAFMRFLANQVARDLLHFRHAGHAADEHQLIHIALGNLRVFQARLHRRNGALHQIIGELFEFCASKLLLDVLRPARVRGNERQIDFVFLHARKRDLRRSRATI